MKFKKVFLFAFPFVCCISSCMDNDPVSPENSDVLKDNMLKHENYAGIVSIMTRNIYVGTDVDLILQTQDPNEIPFVVAEVFQTLKATNFPERAQALAKEIYENQPHLIGLQEVSLIRIQSPGDAVFGGTTSAEDVRMDYLDILMMTLNSYGLEYDIVAKIQNSDVEMPMIVNFEKPYGFDDVRLTDYDVILAKRGVKINNVTARNYRAKVTIPDLGLELPRGYTAVTAEVNGNSYRFVNTHLEDADQGGDLLKIQAAQAAELLLRLARVKIPVIIVGDFNSAAPSELTYLLLTLSHRYQDTWLMNSFSDNPDGFTFGHDSDLLNSEQNFWKRIDYVFVRNGKKSDKKIKLKNVKAEVLGDEVVDKTSSGLWPSDHGGVIAELEFKTYTNHKFKRR
jgi:endonuclease/exonuclease/phosphatase family metal-dependent hydrolase